MIPAIITLLTMTMDQSLKAPPVQVVHLRCENQIEPLAIVADTPRLSWQMDQYRRGTRQTAYQVMVASSPELLKKGKADLWDSGKQQTDQSILVPYQGRDLKSGEKCYWKVRVWGESDKVTAWSSIASWAVGLQSNWDWKAKWIQPHPKETFAPVDPFDDNPAPLLRKSFHISKSIRRATVYASGLGFFELYLNGSKVGDHHLDPGWTDFAKRVSYSTFDVTSQLRTGKNAIGAMLGNGWFNPLPLKMWGHLNLREHLAIGDPRLIVQLVIEHKDGTHETVVTDPSWRCADGPVIRNSVYLGEVYDARAEIPDWCQPSFDDASWGKAILATGVKTDNLEPLATPPIRVTKTLKPVRITEPKPGVYIVEFGQNFAGVTRMKVKGSAGTRVRLRSGELLYDDGTLNGMTSVAGQAKSGGKDYVYPGKGEPKTAFQIDEYICKGKGTEVFQPRFTFHGFRYVEVTGYPGKPKLEDFEGLRMNSDVEKVGAFECSNPMFNRIQTMVEWTLLSNLFSVQSDCPHREKFGYGGDQVATSEMAMYNFDMQRFYANTAEMLAESARSKTVDNRSLFAGLTETAPFVGIADEGFGDGSGPVEWGAAMPLLMNQLADYYGDRRPLQNCFDMAVDWVWFLGLHEEKDGTLRNGIGDHETLAPKSIPVTGTAFLVAQLDWLAKAIPTAAGRSEYSKQKYKRSIVMEGIEPGSESDIAHVKSIADLYRKTFAERFIHADGKVDIGTQCCQAMPLALGLVPEDMKAKVLDVLIKDIEAHDYHLTTGIFGTKYLFKALSDAGRDDIAYKIANQKTFPGWGYMLERGATTLWEHWDYSDNTFSHNHPMFGSISEWFYRSLLGIRPAKPGFKEIIIKPSVVGDLTWAKGHHDCPYGRIEVSWKREKDQFTLDVSVPPNTTATIMVPGQHATPDSDECVETMGGTSRIFRVQSGRYRFTSQL